MDGVGETASSWNALASQYGEEWASEYDHLTAGLEDVSPIVDFLRAYISVPGEAIEFGVGTGRVAARLKVDGLKVIGVDSSPSMLEILRSKRLAHVQAVLADCREWRSPVRSSLVYIVFNTLFLIGDRDSQARCLEAAKASLSPGGALVIEVFVPQVPAPGGTKEWEVNELIPEGIVCTARSWRRAAQRLDIRRITLRNAVPPAILSSTMHYCSPGELDSLAEVSGLSLEARYEGWDRTPFRDQSMTQIAVYRA